MTIIIDAENAVFGRLCSLVAKKALEGDDVIIVNSEKIIITGNKENIIKTYRTKRARGGASRRGPHYPKIPFMILKRGIRGMLPDYRWGEGKQAFSRIKCYEGIPKEFEKKEKIKFEDLNKNKYIKLEELSKKI